MNPIAKIMVSCAPTPIAPFSHACWAGDFLFVTGQMPIDPITNTYVTGSIHQQTQQVLENLLAVLTDQHLGLTDVVSVRSYLTDMDNYDNFNTVYKAFFGDVELPARTCIGVTGLAGGAAVEIDLVAYKQNHTFA